ncbi:hypothetical protein COLO4_17157 [Corchorus olitorius]|uniref:RRM domain-containing protein n=1 Tax=Corchorus olitorius TaxID=93759 RepID=A0A1R3JDW9_9ROSI|nr:hypothetical protein COLO4_17157 [Corchorus olitorius]
MDKRIFGGVGQHSKPVDRRSSLFSVFIGNLSHRVSRFSLWDAFSDYGRITDVFIKKRSKQKGPTTYAIVRYWVEKDAHLALEKANQRFLEGTRIKISKARETRGQGRAARFKCHSSNRGEGEMKDFAQHRIDGRSFKEVVKNGKVCTGHGVDGGFIDDRSSEDSGYRGSSGDEVNLNDDGSCSGEKTLGSTPEALENIEFINGATIAETLVNEVAINEVSEEVVLETVSRGEVVDSINKRMNVALEEELMCGGRFIVNVLEASQDERINRDQERDSNFELGHDHALGGLTQENVLSQFGILIFEVGSRVFDVMGKD